MFKSSIHCPLEIDSPFIFRVKKVSALDVEQNYPVICLIKIDGIIFGRNSSTLDMSVIQVKVVRPEKLPSDNGQVVEHVEKPEKPFYNDNASVAASHYSKQQKEQLMNDERVISLEKISEVVEVPPPVLQEVPPILPTKTKEQLKCEMLVAMVENNFEKMQELSNQLKQV